MARYQLSPQALRSLTQISDYTLEQFGRGQQKRYLQSLRTAMQATADNPGRARDRSEIKAGYFSVPVGKHTLYFRKQPWGIEIIDVLHQSMEPTLHL